MSSEQKVIPFPVSGIGREGLNTAEERRCGQDRRRHSWRTVTYCGLHGRGRRREIRRAGHNYYLDWYQPRLVLTGLALFLFSCLDALFTLTLLNRGAYEANVFMARLLQSGIGIFVTTKIVLTGLGVLFLLMHSHFRILGLTSGKRALQLLLGAYGLLLIYEVVLLIMVS
jgi:hypothetical protein